MYHKYKTSHEGVNFVENDDDNPRPRKGWHLIDKPKNSRRRGWFSFGSSFRRKSLKDDGKITRSSLDVKKTRTSVMLGLDNGNDLLASKTSHEGYMSIQYGKESWQRRYFVLHGPDLFFYKDLRAFEKAPEKPYHLRPLDLRGYTIAGISVEPPWRLTLCPIDPQDKRSVVLLSCDTFEEMNIWSQMINDIIQKSDSGKIEWDVVE